MTKFMTLGALAIGFACTDKSTDSTGTESDTDTDSDSDSDTDTNPSGATATWGTTSVSVDVTGGSGSYKFGIYESGTDAWTAEDCIGGTYTTTGGTTFGPFCHTVAGGTSTTIPCAKTADGVDDGHTLFCQTVKNNGNADFLTYYVAASDDSWCGVAGPDASHYSSMGCDSW